MRKNKKEKNYLHRASAGTFNINGDLRKIDDKVLWNMDVSLAILIRDWLRKFANESIGCPGQFYNEIDDTGFETWKDIILEAADNFNYYSCFENEDEEKRKHLDKGIAFLNKYWENLWW